MTTMLRKLTPLLLLLPLSLAAQSFSVDGASTPAKQSKAAKGHKPAKGQKAAAAPAQGSGKIGFGGSIQLSRLANASADALKHHNPAQAMVYAKQATDLAPGNAKLWFLYGYSARLANKLDESTAAYGRGLKIAPGEPDGLSGLAQTYDKLGRTADAKRLLLQVVNAHPERTNDLLIAGELFMRTNDLQNGLAILQKAEARKPMTHTELLMAIAYMKMNQPAKAQSLLALARRRDPNNPDIFRAVANFQREQKDYAGAIKTLLSSPSKKPTLLADLAYTYELSGDLKASAATWAKAAASAPKEIGYQLSAAQAQLRLNDIAKANQFVARAAAIDPNHYRLHAIKGAIAKQQKHTDEAIREYQLAVNTIPQSVPEGQLYPVLLRLNLAELLKSAGRGQEANQQMALAEQQISKLQVEGTARAEFLRVRASIRAADGDLAGQKAAEQDLLDALKLDPNNTNIQLQYATLLWKMKRPAEAQKMYTAVLQRDPKNRYALEGMGYLMRDDGKIAEAERYFHALAAAYPDDYVPYLALGDMYTSLKRYDDAITQYEKGYTLSKGNPALIANAANAALELHKLDVAQSWLARASAEQNSDVRIMRERERYLFYKGDYETAAKLGNAVLQQLPNDRNASVYLAYSLYNLGRRDDVLALASKYEQALPKEPNFPLLEGHVHRQGQLLDQAVDDYTRAIERDPKMVEAYVNRGYVYNDMQNAEAALQDFDKALALQPKNGIAQLGRSFSNLEMRRAAPALDNAQAAKNLMGDSGAVELALATAYRQQRRLRDAETHYHAALGYAPNDITLWLALADTQYQARQYNDSIASLNQALQLDAHDPLIYAEMAHSYAKMKQKDNTYNAIKQAEQEGSDQSAVLLATGDALLTLGDRDAAMERYGRAMRAPDANRIDVRLALARVFASQGKYDDARQQISLGFADARVGESSPASAENLIEAGNLFLGMHEYNLAFNFYDRARQAGAPEDAVALGEANTYLAQGDDRHAEAALALMGNPQDNTDNYDYQIALGEFYRQKRDLAHAMAAFGRANRMSTDPTDFRTEDSLLQTAGEHGYNLTHDLTVASDTSFAPIFEDTTIYALDAKLVTNGTTALPGPRSTFESRETTAFRYTPNGLPPITAIWQLRDAVGRQSFPSINRVVDRNTLDTSFGAGLSPEVHLGAERIMFNGGVQFTLRRDKRDPLDINENLFRQYLYAETSPLFDWITVRANGFHESGPFTLRNLNSREFGGRVEFQVGRPWAKTFLVTGYTVDDLTFRPLIREYFTTSTYAGLQHKFGDRLTVTGLAELIRSWRVQDIQFATAQAIAPGANVDARLTRSLSLNAFGTWQSNKTIGAFDNVQSGFFISYTRPLSQVVNDGLGAVRIEFPLRISLGLQQESFMHLTGTTGSNTIIRPVIRVTIF